MDFDGQHVVAIDERIDGQCVFVELLSVVRRIGCERVVAHLSAGHVRTDNLRTVEVDDGAVVSTKGEFQTHDSSAGDIEVVSEVEGGGAAGDGGGLVAFAEAELRGSGFPGGVVEVRLAPSGALIGPVVEVTPRGPQRDEFFTVGARQRERKDGRQ